MFARSVWTRFCIKNCNREISSQDLVPIMSGCQCLLQVGISIERYLLKVLDCFLSDESLSIFLSVAESVEVAFPFSPSVFGSSVDLSWILSTEVGYVIRISFSEFQTRDDLDVLRAGDGNNSANFSQAFFVWSGSREAPDLLSFGQSMWLRLTSAELAAGSGFVLRATSVPSTGMRFSVNDEM